MISGYWLVYLCDLCLAHLVEIVVFFQENFEKGLWYQWYFCISDW